MNEIKLTQFSKGSGCGCKLAPEDLNIILNGLYSGDENKKLLVGNNCHDDAAVYELENDECLISTTDFFTPIVDDPYDFGRIAAANAISDVYAMGGSPFLALAILGWPIGKIAHEHARKVMEGAKTICREAGVMLAGGHSIDAPEPFFGLSVNGRALKTHLKKNATTKAGDIIYITKPIGSGILSTALKRGVLNNEHYAELLKHLTELNKAGEFFGTLSEVTAMTDVTGFSLLGHLLEMCNASGTHAEVSNASIPLMSGVEKLTKQFIYPDNTMRNYKAIAPNCVGLTAQNMFTLCDPQTNGGLMVTVNENFIAEFEKLSSENNIFVQRIGKMVAGDGSITIY